MNLERIAEPEATAKDFGFIVERVDAARKRVTIRDGAEEWIFMDRAGKPFIIGRPNREVSQEKMSALTRQAAAILERL